MSSLRLEDLSNNGVRADKLHIAAGGCCSLAGPSGSGKTLLLRAIVDLDQANGEVWLDDQARSQIGGPEWRRRVIYVAADSQWWLPRVREHADDWHCADLGALGFDQDVLDWEVQRMSSGERQRLALARALAHGPQALLLDEPTANLDQHNTELIEELLACWRRNSRGCVLWVSHDPAQRARVADQQALVRNGVLEHTADA